MQHEDALNGDRTKYIRATRWRGFRPVCWSLQVKPLLLPVFSRKKWMHQTTFAWDTRS